MTGIILQADIFRNMPNLNETAYALLPGVFPGIQPTMAKNWPHLQREIGARLRELRKTAANNLSPEDIAPRAKEKGFPVGARTIRQWEAAKGNPSLESLHNLLNYYGTTIGEFFRFNVEAEEGRIVADFLELLRRPKMRDLVKQFISTMRQQ